MYLNYKTNHSNSECYTRMPVFHRPAVMSSWALNEAQVEHTDKTHIVWNNIRSNQLRRVKVVQQSPGSVVPIYRHDMIRRQCESLPFLCVIACCVLWLWLSVLVFLLNTGGIDLAHQIMWRFFRIRPMGLKCFVDHSHRVDPHDTLQCKIRRRTN